jgi:hypothetical protein
MSPNEPISCCSEAFRREKPRRCWSNFTRRELPFALNPEGLLPSLGRRLSSISVWTQRELAKSLRFTTIFLGMDCRIVTHLSFVIIATSNQNDEASIFFKAVLIWCKRAAGARSSMKRLLVKPRASVSSIRTCPWACEVNSNSYWSDQAGLKPRGQDRPGQLAS